MLAGLRLDGGLAAWVGGLGGLALYAGLWALTPTLLLARRIPLRRLMPTIVLTATAVAAFELVSCDDFPSLATTNAQRYGLIGFAFSLFSWFFIHQVVVVAGLVGAVVDQARTADPKGVPAQLEPANLSPS